MEEGSRKVKGRALEVRREKLRLDGKINNNKNVKKRRRKRRKTQQKLAMEEKLLYAYSRSG